MRKILFAISLLGALTLALAVSAAAPANFAGTWNLDKAKSQGLSPRLQGADSVSWIITQTDRFRAAVPAASIANLISFNYMAYYHDYLAVEFGSLPHEHGLIDLLWERSPIRYANKVKTPTMLMTGEEDWRTAS